MSKQNEVAGPIKGAQGAYFVKVINRQADDRNDVESLKATMARDYSRKQSSAMQVLQNATKIKDNRSRFF